MESQSLLNTWVLVEKFDTLHLSHKKPFSGMRFTENGNNLLSIYDKYRYKAIDSSKVKSTQKGNLHLGKCSSSHKVKQLGWVVPFDL